MFVNLQALFNPQTWISFFYIFGILIVSLTLHGFAHCWVDYRLGDNTARNDGRVSLNPMVHLDLVGTVMMAISALFGIGMGWGKPLRFNPKNFRHPLRDTMLAALAGPFSNVLQMLACGSFLLLLQPLLPNLPAPLAGFLTDLCHWGIGLNGFLAIFNLLPIYPLDGHHVLLYFAPASWRPIITNPMWQVVVFALVFIPLLNTFVLQPILIPFRFIVGGFYWLALGQLPEFVR